MAPTAVLIRLPSTHPTTTIKMNSEHSNNRSNNCFPSPLALLDYIHLILAFISIMQSAPVMSPSALLSLLLSAPHVIVKRLLRSFSTVWLSLLPIRLLFLSVNSWPLLLRIFLSIRGHLREKWRSLSLIFVPLFLRR